LFFHGSDDELIAPALGRQLYEAAAEPKQLITTPGGHNTSGFEYNWGYMQRLRTWLSAALVD
jgi:fermentation-respiration switch protein FrsA (DUF1100 family)